MWLHQTTGRRLCCFWRPFAVPDSAREGTWERFGSSPVKTAPQKGLVAVKGYSGIWGILPVISVTKCNCLTVWQQRCPPSGLPETVRK